MPFLCLFETGQDPADCLDTLSYADWVDFVMEHPTPWRAHGDRWYSSVQATKRYFKDKERFLRHAQQLFSHGGQLVAAYSPGQIEQGLWCLISAFELNDLLTDPDVSLESRLRCVAALEPLYLDVLSRPRFEELVYKFLNPLTFDYYNLPSDPSHDLMQMRDGFFATLTRLLNQRTRSVFLGALYGLGRLRHPDSQAAIQLAISKRSDLTWRDLKYAQSRADGGLVMDQYPKMSR